MVQKYGGLTENKKMKTRNEKKEYRPGKKKGQIPI